MTAGRSELDLRLARLRDALGQEAVEDALRFLPTHEVEEAVVREEQERHQAERTATALTMRETRDAVLAGNYGKDAKARLANEIVTAGDPNAGQVLQLAAKLAAQERKAEYYRRLNGQKKDAI